MAATKEKTAKTVYVPRIKSLYREQVAPELKKEFDLGEMQIPRIEKIVVSVSMGREKDNKRMFEIATNTLAKITGQQPVETIAKKSIASFKLREGNRIGLMVTLRGDMMYEFYDRLVNIAMPRLRDFHGMPIKSFDSQGNYNLGLKEQSIFPELSYEEIAIPHGLEVTIVTTSDDKKQSKALLSKLGMPFEKKEFK